MGTPLYCRCGLAWTNCGYLPATCPSCKRETKWTTTAPTGTAIFDPNDPVKPYELTDWDTRLLRALRITGV